MSPLENTLFQLKFTAKSLSRQAKRSQKNENVEKERVKKALQKNDIESARVYASNAIRKKSEALDLLRLSSRIDAVASRIETAMTMRQVTGNMTSVVREMDRAMSSMNLDKISLIMDKFDSQLSDMDVHASVVQDSMRTSTAELEPQDQIDRLLRQTAEEANIELQHDLAAKDISSVPDLSVSSSSTTQSLKDEDDKLADRLRALRPVVS